MNQIQELKIHVEGLYAAIKQNQKFFAPIAHYVERLKQMLTSATDELSQDELKILADRIEEFYREWRPTKGGGIYIPPRETADTDPTVQQINRIVGKLATLDVEDFKQLVPEKVKGEPAIPVPNPILMVERICNRFHLVARQLRDRHDSRETLAVEDEYDVQDLLHALLTLEFDDIRPEEWTPSYAGSASRVDFLLKQEQIVIEAKKTRKGLGAKEVGEQLMIDIQRYQSHPDCRTLICFVYDPEARIANPRGIENDLGGQHNKLEVKVIIAPKGL